MSMRVSFTSNTRTEGRLCIRVATFLNYPGIAIGIGEVRKARVVGSARIGTDLETSLPLAAVDVLVPDGADADASIDEFVANRRDVGHHEVEPLNRTEWGIRQPDAELY